MLYEIIIVRSNIIGLMSSKVEEISPWTFPDGRHCEANKEKMSIFMQRRKDTVGTLMTPPLGC